MTSTEILQVITGCIGSLGFGIIFNIRGKKLIAVTVGGFFAWLFFVLLGFFFESEPLRYMIVAAIIAIYSEIMARIQKTPTITFTMTCLIPLVPGSALFYSMQYALESKAEQFINMSVNTIQIAASLAIGVLIVTAIARTIKKNNSK